MRSPEPPQADRGSVVELLHGQPIADPYRYLEDPDAAATVEFVRAQNAVSAPYLAALPGRPAFLDAATALLTAPRQGVPWTKGGRYLMVSNPGELDQDLVQVADSLAELNRGGRVLLDPNGLSADGTVALGSVRVSPDGQHVAYTLSEAGSDWMTIRVRNIDTLVDLPDELTWCKFVAPTWLPDGRSFLYWIYPEPVAGTEFTDAMGAGRLMQHRLGEDPALDREVWSRPEAPEWFPYPYVAPDGTWLVLTISPGTDSRTTVSALRLAADATGLIRPSGELVPVIPDLQDSYDVIGVTGDRLLLQTDAAAPRGRLVQVDLAHPDREPVEVIAEHPQDVLVSVQRAAGALLVIRSHDASHRLECYSEHGIPWEAPELPEVVTVTALTSEWDSAECFLGISSFTHRLRRFRLDLADPTVLQPLPADTPAAEVPASSTERVRATSTDGAEVPMTIIRRPDLPPGPRPTLMYGYGGFDIAITPSFSALFTGWVAAGGVLAVMNLRGGGEFGSDWHHQGMLEHKQQVFDDAISCAEHLIVTGVSTPEQLAVHGRSNGGLLVGALLTQRPDLFAVALPSVGVLDMLRFHQFTIGWAWTSEFGTPEDADQFATLLAYSPLHQLRDGVNYPATLICTGDHDDRVVPAHSLKFGAELQRVQAGHAPVLLRVDTRAGHGAGKPARALAAEYADVLAFAAVHTGLT